MTTIDNEMYQQIIALAWRHSGPAGSGWAPATSEEVGFAPDVADRVAEAVRSGHAANLHGLAVVRHGRLVLEYYGSGEDFMWGYPLGEVDFGPETLHDLRSVTKGVVALLYGIALADGRVPEPDEPLLRSFPEYPDLGADPGRAELTVGHALTMTLGIEWNEDAPYTSDANSEIAMELAPDRYRYILERPVVEQPGVRWVYCGGASALLGRLITKGTGRPLPEYARDVLFAPLGIGAVEWMHGADGTASAASGLRLAPRDLARIGQAVLAGGVWQGRQIIPAAWLDAALRPRVRIGDGFHYGYQWYAGESADGDSVGRRWVEAIGNGGQRLYVFPELDLVVAMTAGNYDTGDEWVTPKTILQDVILASLRSG